MVLLLSPQYQVRETLYLLASTPLPRPHSCVPRFQVKRYLQYVQQWFCCSGVVRLRYEYIT